MSSTAKKRYGPRPRRWGASRPACPASRSPSRCRRPGLEPPPEQALVERPPLLRRRSTPSSKKLTAPLMSSWSQTYAAAGAVLDESAPVGGIDDTRAERARLEQLEVEPDASPERMASRRRSRPGWTNSRYSSIRPSRAASAARPAPPIASLAVDLSANSSARPRVASRGVALDRCRASSRTRSSAAPATSAANSSSTSSPCGTPSPSRPSSRTGVARTGARRAHGSARCGRRAAPGRAPTSRSRRWGPAMYPSSETPIE